jgi:hypothetical protein
MPVRRDLRRQNRPIKIRRPRSRLVEPSPAQVGNARNCDWVPLPPGASCTNTPFRFLPVNLHRNCGRGAASRGHGHDIAHIGCRCLATFQVLPCCYGAAKGNIAMRTNAAYYYRAALYGWRRNRVLRAIMLYSVVVGVAAVMAAFAVWRARYLAPAL